MKCLAPPVLCLVFAGVPGCARTPASVAPLQSVPLLATPAELDRWRVPPAPAADAAHWALELGVVRTVLPNGVGVTVVSHPDAVATAVQLRIPAMRDLTEGPVAVMGEALRSGTAKGTVRCSSTRS